MGSLFPFRGLCVSVYPIGTIITGQKFRAYTAKVVLHSVVMFYSIWGVPINGDPLYCCMVFFLMENSKIKWMITRGTSMTYESIDYYYYGAFKCFKPQKQIWQDIERNKPL